MWNRMGMPWELNRRRHGAAVEERQTFGEFLLSVARLDAGAVYHDVENLETRKYNTKGPCCPMARFEATKKIGFYLQ